MKTELMIPFWPDQPTISDKLGCGPRYRDLSTSDSLWIPFRARSVDEGYDFSDAASIWQYIGMYVWISADYGISLEVKAHDVHSASVDKLELLLKTLKWAHKRLDGIGKITTDNLPFKLVEFCTRLKIKRTIMYRSLQKDEFGPIDEVLQLICTEITTSMERLKKI